MECNKDDAVRAKEIADRKFMERDYASAKRFALKAQSLYPGLDGLTQMLTIFDVHLCAENKISGEADCRCKTHYEYLRIYLNHNLLCPNCHQAFFAVEKAPPAHVFKSSNLPYDQMQQNSKHRAGGSNKSASGVSASTASQGPSRVHHQVASESERSNFVRREEFIHKGENPLKKRRVDEHHSHVFGGSVANEMDRMYYSSGKNKMPSERVAISGSTTYIDGEGTG
ncbi:hypothetical protein NL676_017950 [Syzygium grande]|nr:hypothetical protein NL676_017950 [Syzygium grande]